MPGWYDDGSEEQAQMERRLAQRQIEERRAETAIERACEEEAQRIHELRLDAAGEMYAALKAILSFFESGDFVRDVSHDFEQGWHLRMIPVVKSLADANAAIAKAEGR
jgi:hypothetical protein